MNVIPNGFNSCIFLLFKDDPSICGGIGIVVRSLHATTVYLSIQTVLERGVDWMVEDEDYRHIVKRMVMMLGTVSFCFIASLLASTVIIEF
jgi:hypothetical protein